MRFVDWLDSEIQALDRLDAQERGEIPPGPVEFRKAADGSTFCEFIQFAKDNGDGSRSTVICNEGGLAMLEAAQSVDIGAIVSTVNEATIAVNELSKRVDALAAAQADLVEVDAGEIVKLFEAAVDEAGA